MNLKNRTSRTVLFLALGTMAAAVAASSPHFVRGPFASINTSNGNVTVSWKEAGLGDTVSVDYEASALGTARYQCVNRGGNCPAASNKEDVMADVSVGGTFNVDKNGRITNALTILAPESTLQCPGNQVVGVVRVEFTGIELEDITNGISSPTNPTSLTYNAPECP